MTLATRRTILVLLVLLMLVDPAYANVSTAPLPVPSYSAALDPAQSDTLGIQAFLDGQPGPLKHYRDADDHAATIVESNSLYYGISPRLHLALLETVHHLLSDASPAADALRQPYGAAGPDGFADQIEWASRELRAGLGPYERPPTVRFTDGTTTTLTLEQAPEGVAVQRFLAIGRSAAEWRTLVERFGQVFQDYFDNKLPDLAPPPTAFTGPGFLHLPWPAGTRVVHLAYFDHMYPTVDSGKDDNSFVVTYLGHGNVQYNTHDGHDYYFPDQPIGTRILATAPGVAYARTHRGKGVVILHDNGYETVYWHLDGFASIFKDRIDSNQGVWVDTGDVIGVSGKTGFVVGSPHLHFEVRHYGRQVDPYGWYGSGPDPCAAYAGCASSVWLWHPSLRGTYDFTPPDVDQRLVDSFRPDETAPVGTVSINPPDDVRFLARFDDHVLQQVGHGFPVFDGLPKFEEGNYDQGLLLAEREGLTYPISDNLRLEAGTISLWAHIPERYPTNSINRHYLFAASANPDDDAGGYPGTLALRRDLLGSGDTPQWTFWTTSQDGATRDTLSAPDTLDVGWHHFAVTWDTAKDTKTLHIDGKEVAAVDGVALPTDVGRVLQIGRFTYGGRQSGMMLDELAIFERALTEAEIDDLAAAATPLPASTTVLTQTNVRIDTNALDAEGGIVALQIGHNGVFKDPQPYYDTFRWRLPPVEGEHDIAVRYFDRASNSTTVTQTVELNLPPRGQARVAQYDEVSATLTLTATDQQAPISVQVSSDAAFPAARWQRLRPEMDWTWDADQRPDARATTSSAKTMPPLFVRFRDASGEVSAPIRVTVPTDAIYLPVITSGQSAAVSIDRAAATSHADGDAD